MKEANKPEEIVTKLRQVEVLTGQDMPRLDAIRQIGVTEQLVVEQAAKGNFQAPLVAVLALIVFATT